MKISYETRKELIWLVEEDKLSVAEACRRLNIRETTGRAIYKKFKTEGTIFETRRNR